MADATDPVGRLIDLALYAPVGLFTLAQQELPGLIATGKTRVDNQLTLARFIGKMVVRQGSNEFKRRMQTAEQARREPQLAPLSEPLALTVVATGAIDPVPKRSARATSTQRARAGSEDTLPIDGYDSLAASQVVLRLGSLNTKELESVRGYEERNRSRRTILGKIAQLQAR